MNTYVRASGVVAVALLLGACGMVPTLSASRCAKGATIQPGMTERQVVSLMGNPYAIRLDPSGTRYTWMNKEEDQKVSVSFAPVMDGKLKNSKVISVSGSCDGKNF